MIDPNVFIGRQAVSPYQRPSEDLCLVAGRSIERYEWIGPDGAKYNLHSMGNVSLLHEQGAGMPPIEYVTQRGPFQDGETVTDVFLRPRLVQLLLRVNTRSRAQYWNARDTLVRMLSPQRASPIGIGHLRYYLPNGTVRQLDAVIQTGPKFEPRAGDTWDEWSLQEVLQFTAHNPLWYDPTARTLIVQGGQGQLTFPFIFPFSFSGLDSTLNVLYAGSWKAFPTIVINGPITGPTITNESTGELILLNYALSAGQQITINLQPNNKSVTLSDGTNLIRYVDGTSSLTTFHLEPSPGVTGGNNVLHLTGSGATTATYFQVTWNDQFLGI